MTCDEISQSEIIEQYLLGRLDESACDAFEQHLFACERCLDRVQTFRALRHELASTAASLRAEPLRPSGVWAWKWAWAPALAVLVVTAGIVVSVFLRSGPSLERGAPVGGQSARGAATSPGPASSESVSSLPSLVALARFEPPAYVPQTLRGVQSEAAAQFRDAMRHYVAKDYRRAIRGLRTASELDPEAPHASFFLGICYVLTGQVEPGIRALQQTIALGDSPYLEDAHFHLAKALLLKKDATGARREWERTRQLRGDREDEARHLRDELDRLSPPPSDRNE
jgi:tetratricopeptide (TPR) repeat protein